VITRGALLRTIAAQAAETATLRRRISDLTWNGQLGCPKREAIEEAWSAIAHARMAMIFLDLDGLNALNYAHGYEAIDERIAAVWADIRPGLRATDPHGQWQGGDEFVIAAPHADAYGLAVRAQAMLGAHDLSASRVIVEALPCIAATVAGASHALHAARGGARGEGRRGVLVDSRNQERTA
jgi:GGDEF domain-containing protein